VALFKSLAGFMAPFAICEADEHDFRQALGTARCPALLAHAVWNRETQQLHFMSEQDMTLIAKSSKLFVTAFERDGDWTISKQLIGLLRRTCKPDAFFGLSITRGFFEGNMPNWSPLNCSPVVAVCKT
jgi:hypothetical protein